MVLSCSWVYADLESCWSPAPPLIAFCLPLIARRTHCLGPCRVGWSYFHGQVCVILFIALGLGAWGLIGEWRFQVTLFSGPSILQAPGEGLPWVVPAYRVAMDTSPPAYGFCSPLTFPAPVPKLIYCDEFKCG